MENWLTISNVSNEQVSVKIQVNGPGSSATRKYNVAAHASIRVPIHNTSLFSVSSATYGMVIIQSSREKSIISELLRVRSDNAGGFEFIAPTALN